MLLVLLAHADASVRDAVVHLDVLPVSDRLVFHLEADRATILRELDGVTEDVDQHLADTELVCVHILRRRRGALDDKLDIPPLQEAMGHGQYGVGDFSDIARHRLVLDLAALDTADIEHVVDERHEVVRALHDLLEAVPELLLRTHRKRDVREADDGIHRGTYIVRHAVQEGRLRHVGSIGLACLRERRLELSLSDHQSGQEQQEEANDGGRDDHHGACIGLDKFMQCDPIVRERVFRKHGTVQKARGLLDRLIHDGRHPSVILHRDHHKLLTIRDLRIRQLFHQWIVLQPIDAGGCNERHIGLVIENRLQTVLEAVIFSGGEIVREDAHDIIRIERVVGRSDDRRCFIEAAALIDDDRGQLIDGIGRHCT